jgi:3-oxoacyl-[acyl-carrier protein] reductase
MKLTHFYTIHQVRRIMQDFDFSKKVILVTGGSRGIGRACSEAFAQRGAQVAINYHSNEDAAKSALRSLPGGPHNLFRCDLANPGAVSTMIQSIIEEMGQLDIVVNNAGIYREHPIEEVGFAEWTGQWDQILNINLRGPANIMYWAARHMMERRGGRIVNVSSRGAFRGEPESPAYGASKAGLNALSQSLARKLAPYNITVGLVAPGFVETDMVQDMLAGSQGDAIRAQSPFGRVAKPEEVARAVLFLAAPGSEFSTGTIIDVNGASYLRS